MRNSSWQHPPTSESIHTLHAILPPAFDSSSQRANPSKQSFEVHLQPHGNHGSAHSVKGESSIHMSMCCPFTVKKKDIAFQTDVFECPKPVGWPGASRRPSPPVDRPTGARAAPASFPAPPPLRGLKVPLFVAKEKTKGRPKPFWGGLQKNTPMYTQTYIYIYVCVPFNDPN